MALSGPGVVSMGSRKAGLTIFKSSSFTPKSITGLQLWLKADAITPVADSTAIGTWPDSSGNASDATQATGGLQPLYRTGANGINGVPAVSFDGVDDLMASAASAALASQTIFAVVKVTDFAVSRTPHGSSANGGLQFRVDATTGTLSLVKQAIAGIGTSSGTVTAGTATVIEVTYNSATGAFVFYKNGTSIGSGTSIQTLTASTTVLGKSAELFKGLLGEELVYDSVLSTANRQLVESYLRTKWGTP